MIADNSAGRLLGILLKAMNVRSQGGTLMMGWSRVFAIPISQNNVPPSFADDEELVHRILELHKLADEAESDVRALEGINHQLYLRPFPRVRAVLPKISNLQGDFNSVMGQLSEGDMTVLEFCAEELSKRHQEKVADEAILKEIAEEVQALFDSVKDSQLPEDLKKFLLRQLANIRRAVEEYHIRGIERLKEVLEEMVGAVAVNEEVLKREAGTEQLSAFRRIVSKLVSVYEFAKEAKPLLGPTARIIGLLMSNDPDVPPIDIPPIDQ